MLSLGYNSWRRSALLSKNVFPKAAVVPTRRLKFRPANSAGQSRNTVIMRSIKPPRKGQFGTIRDISGQWPGITSLMAASVQSRGSVPPFIP
jgi:hypothetical protein